MTARRLATVRLAWRLVRGSRSRSALIAVLVAIPVLAGAFVAVTIRTAHLSPGEAATRELGHADAIAFVGGQRSLGNSAAIGRGNNGETVSNVGYDPRRVPTDTAWARQLPAGSRVTPDRWTRGVSIAAGGRATGVPGVALDLADPMTRGTYRLKSGTAPAASGEAAVTSALASRLRVGVGSSIELEGHAVKISAVVENPESLSSEEVVAPADTLGGLKATALDSFYERVGYWLIDTPASAPDLHNRLKADGVVYETREQWAHPDRALTSSNHVDGQVLLVLATVAGFGLLEVLLLAGAAFAVGTRRQTRELGLLAATGGDATDIRRTVLAEGALLGIGGAMIGSLGGVLAVFLARPVIEHFADRRLGSLDVGATDLIALSVLGVVAGLLAAVVPARAAAARPVLHMLREQYDAGRVTARLPKWSAAAIFGGAAVIVIAAWRWHSAYGSFRADSVGTGSLSTVFHDLGTMLRDNQWPAVLWLGAVVVVAGLVRACPAIVSRLAAGLSGRLPVSARLALRDAGRHRHRTAPAVAAVMTVVAGAVLVLFVVSSTELRDKSEFRPSIPVGLVSLQPENCCDAGTSALLDTAGTRATALLGGGAHGVIADAATRQGATLVAQNPHCAGGRDGGLAVCQFHRVGVASAETIDLVAGHHVATAGRALADGGAVLLDAALADGDKVDVGVPSGKHRSPTHLPATVVPGLPFYGSLPQVYVSAATAAHLGWQTTGDIALVKPTAAPSNEQLDRAQRILGVGVSINLQRGYESRYSVTLLAMLGAAAIATLAGTSISVALAMAESRADMATYAAVGASPARRRMYAMGQAATVAGLGTGIGVALGALVAVATLTGTALYPTSTPYRWLAAVLFGAPFLAIAVAGLFTRSRVPMARRIA
jgi:putative ABC transport system permease protein